MTEKMLIEEIKKEREMLLGVKDKLRDFLKDAPKGSLKTKTRKKNFQYYIDGVYQSVQNLRPAKKIARRDYYLKVLPMINKRLKQIDVVLEFLEDGTGIFDQIYEEMPEARRALFNPFIHTHKQKVLEWLNQDYEKWEIEDEDVKGDFESMLGIRMRNKGEVMFADKVTNAGAFYIYEYKMRLKKGKGYVYKRPDFLVINPRTLQVYVVEIMGKMDDPEYVAEQMEKLRLYEANGYIIGKNLIILQGDWDHPIDSKTMDTVIQEFFV